MQKLIQQAREYLQTGQIIKVYKVLRQMEEKEKEREEKQHGSNQRNCM